MIMTINLKQIQKHALMNRHDQNSTEIYTENQSPTSEEIPEVTSNQEEVECLQNI